MNKNDLFVCRGLTFTIKFDAPQLRGVIITSFFRTNLHPRYDIFGFFSQRYFQGNLQDGGIPGMSIGFKKIVR